MRPDDAERLWFASVDAGLSEDDELSGVDVAEGAGKKAVKTGNAVVTGLAVEAFVVVKAVFVVEVAFVVEAAFVVEVCLGLGVAVTGLAVEALAAVPGARDFLLAGGKQLSKGTLGGRPLPLFLGGSGSGISTKINLVSIKQVMLMLLIT